ncbi:MAG: RHS repeat protein [Acidobacteria bacterium]|nr:RHS repeat protein [Acidobacteriota bacterium]MBI3658166.1 RHS repeat protein [Acidobacteriota bacterium]
MENNPVGQPILITNALGHATRFTYDTNGYLSQERNPLDAVTSFAYDVIGNLLSMTDPNANTTRFEYDPANRLVRITNALSQSTSVAYDVLGNPIRITDANGNATNYRYSTYYRRDLLVSKTNALSFTWTYARDFNGNLIRITDPNSNSKRFSYDALNRLVTTTDALDNTTRYNYDAVGNVTTVVKADTSSAAWAYDRNDRLIETNWLDDTITLSYDAVGNRLSMKSNNASLIYTYDANNRLVGQSEEYLATTISYTYDAVGRRTSMTDLEGGLTNYSHDAAGQLVSLINPPGQETIFAYDLGGRPTTRSYSNGTVTASLYDAADNATSTIHRRDDESIISSFIYTYDNVGNLTSELNLSGLTQYAYDAVDTLRSVLNPDGTGVSYTYDRVGNRIRMDATGVVTNYTYNAADWLLTAGAVGYTYDRNGNRISKTVGVDVTSYAYDFFDRMVGAVLPDGRTNTAAYYPDGSRLRKNEASGLTKNFAYDMGNVLTELDAEGLPTARYTSGFLADQWLSMDRGDQSFFYHEDVWGSIRNLTDINQNIVATTDYDRFGVMTRHVGETTNPFRYTGRELDAELDLYYFEGGHYDPAVGSFLSRSHHPGHKSIEELTLREVVVSTPVYVPLDVRMSLKWDPEYRKEILGGISMITVPGPNIEHAVGRKSEGWNVMSLKSIYRTTVPGTEQFSSIGGATFKAIQTKGIPVPWKRRAVVPGTSIELPKGTNDAGMLETRAVVPGTSIPVMFNPKEYDTSSMATVPGTNVLYRIKPEPVGHITLYK